MGGRWEIPRNGRFRALARSYPSSGEDTGEAVGGHTATVSGHAESCGGALTLPALPRVRDLGRMGYFESLQAALGGPGTANLEQSRDPAS